MDVKKAGEKLSIQYFNVSLYFKFRNPHTSFENCTRNPMKAFLHVQQEKLNHHFQTLWENYIYYENLHFIYVSHLHCFHIRNLYFHNSLINLMLQSAAGIHPRCLGSALSIIFFCFYLCIIYYLTISPISLLLVQMCLWYYLNIVKSMKYFYILIWETVKICYFHEKSAEMNSITTIYLCIWKL